MKKTCCVVLSMILMLCMSIPTMAASKVTLSEDDLQREIEQRMDTVRENIYDQLKMQGAESLLPVYERIIYPDVAQSIMMKYGIPMPSNNSSTRRYYAPNGGLVYGTQPIGVEGYSDLAVAKIGLTGDAAKEWLIRHSGDYINIGDLLGDVIGSAMGDFGFLADLIDISGHISKNLIDEIEASGWNVLIVNTLDTEYDLPSSVYLAWEDYPYITMTGEGDYTFTSDLSDVFEHYDM